MNWADEELIANEWLSGYLGDPDYEIATGKPTPAPGPYRPLIQAKPYANIRQLVAQAAQPMYAPAAITPGLQAALRARQALVTKAPTPVHKAKEAYDVAAQRVRQATTPQASIAAKEAYDAAIQNVQRVTAAVPAASLPVDVSMPSAMEMSMGSAYATEKAMLSQIPDSVKNNPNRALYGVFFLAQAKLAEEVGHAEALKRRGREIDNEDGLREAGEQVRAARYALTRAGDSGDAEKFLRGYISKAPPYGTHARDVWFRIGSTLGTETEANILRASSVVNAEYEKFKASQQRESLLRTKLASNAYAAMPPEARYESIQKDMALVIAEAEYQRSPAARQPQPVAADFVGTVNAAADIKAKASAWASGLFGGSGK